MAGFHIHGWLAVFLFSFSRFCVLLVFFFTDYGAGLLALRFKRRWLLLAGWKWVSAQAIHDGWIDG